MAICYQCDRNFYGRSCENCGWVVVYECWNCGCEVTPDDYHCKRCGWFECSRCGECGCSENRPSSNQEIREELGYG